MNSITYKRASTTQELKEILALQKANSKQSISNLEKLAEGFVTVEHSLSILERMNKACAHIIATHNNKVVGYALCMTQDFEQDIEILKPMFKQVRAKLNPTTTYLVMGQICIAKEYRKQGIFKRLYTFMQQELNTTYDVLITEVDKANTRSMQAHYTVGFTSLHEYNSGQQWDLLIWKW